MAFIQSWLTIIILVAFFVKLRIGLVLYLVYFFLVPYFNINFLGISLSWNFANILLLIAFVIDYYKHHGKVRLDLRPFYPFIFFYAMMLIMMPFQEFVPTDIALNSWRASGSIGILTSDGVLFAGDLLIGEETLSKYDFLFLQDVEEYLKSLDIVETVWLLLLLSSLYMEFFC